MSFSSSNETNEPSIDDYDDYYEPMVPEYNPCPTPPPSPPYPYYPYQANPYPYPYQANPLTEWVPVGVWTPWTPYNTSVSNSYLSYAMPYQNPYPGEWTPWTPYLAEPYPWTNNGINSAGMYTPPPSPVTIPPGSILTPPMLLVPIPIRPRWYHHPRPKQTLALKKNYVQVAPPKENLALKGTQERHEMTIWDQIQGSFSELQSSSKDTPSTEELKSEEEDQPDHDEDMNGDDEMRAYELAEVGVEQVENAPIRDEVEEIFIDINEDEFEDLANTLAGDNAEEILNALAGNEEEDLTNAPAGDEEEKNNIVESSFELVEPMAEGTENNDSDDNPLLLHMKECGLLSCKDRGKPHMHTSYGTWLF
ncbi:unnamed protein product [Cylicocyclus nassatus]|uniref:Uncharacterized protein n=1 Tax=Cylicocyclus nassatus TaxID=53992 RepID=A0AA36HE56_CYLNA|nr:unnamed protein product [Cylicocyclus nassatus]